jgi:hypothetical protein
VHGLRDVPSGDGVFRTRAETATARACRAQQSTRTLSIAPAVARRRLSVTTLRVRYGRNRGTRLPRLALWVRATRRRLMSRALSCERCGRRCCRGFLRRRLRQRGRRSRQLRVPPRAARRHLRAASRTAPRFRRTARVQQTAASLQVSTRFPHTSGSVQAPSACAHRSHSLRSTAPTWATARGCPWRRPISLIAEALTRTLPRGLSLQTNQEGPPAGGQAFP